MLGTVPALPYAFATDPGVLTYALPAAMKGWAAADFSCVIEDEDGAVLVELIQPTHYSVTISRTYGVTLTFVDDTWLTAGNVGVVDRQTARTQPVKFSELDDFPGHSVELQGDRQVAMAQDIWARLERGLRARRGETLPDLPAKVSLFGAIPYLNADGSAWETIIAEYVAALGADLALGAASNINRLGPYAASIVALGDETASMILLAPYAAALGDLADNLGPLLAAYAVLTCPELTVV